MEKRLRFNVENIDCASCALSIEEEISKENDLKDVTLNFSTLALSVTANNPSDELDERLQRIADKIEPGARIISRAETQRRRQAEFDKKLASGEETHAEKEKDSSLRTSIISMSIAGVLLILGFVLPLFSFTLFGFSGATIANALLLISAILAGYPIFRSSLASIRNKTIDENLLAVIAVIAAFSIGEFKEAAVVTLFFRVGEFFEEVAVNRSRRSIAALSDILPDRATLLFNDGTTEIVPAESIEAGDVIQILPFERVALDGTILSGQSEVDAAAITGESLPINVSKDSTLMSGMVNGSGTLEMQVTNSYETSAASRIIDMVENAASRKGSAERKITTFAKYYTPAVVVLAILMVAIPALFGGDWMAWLQKALILLVAACPCALVLSVPLSFFAGIGAASRQGILVKGGQFVEALEKPEAVIFDKTGTLTTGDFEVKEIHVNGNHTKDEVLRIAAYGEALSSHPIGKSIVRHYGKIDESKIENFREVPGNGASITLDGQDVFVGSKALLEQNGIDMTNVPDCQVYVGLAGEYLGGFYIEGELRPDAKEMVDTLKKQGVKRIAMLTGDSEPEATSVANALGIDEYHFGLLPEDKLRILEEIKTETKGSTIFVGDGINDAPVLAAADVGVTMGSATDVAIEAGDLVLMNSSLTSLTKAIALFRRTMGTVRFNIGFALFFKVIVLVLAFAGSASMWMAVFADVGVSVISVIIASRLLRIPKEKGHIKETEKATAVKQA